MPIKDYGVLKGKASQRILATKKSEHYQILVNHGDDPHRIAINTQSGDPLTSLPPNDPGQPENAMPVRIMAAMINPKGGDAGKEYVILLNTGTDDVNLSGWKIADKQRTRTG